MERVRAVIGILKSEGYCVFLLAIAISLAWHVFWLSVIKVVSVSDTKSAVRFSRVSFLGPILANEGAGFGVQPKELSFLERRYFTTIGSAINSRDVDSGAGALISRDYEADLPSQTSSEGEIASLVADAVSGEKLEPPRISGRRRP